MINDDVLKRKQLNMYFNINFKGMKLHKLDNCYNKIISNSKIYDIATLQNEPKLNNSREFIKEIANYSI